MLLLNKYLFPYALFHLPFSVSCGHSVLHASWPQTTYTGVDRISYLQNVRSNLSFPPLSYGDDVWDKWLL